ncbi:hypothetical protein DERP_000170 [Dermatophagoides pteronyssinus]|uniref:Uncharacterized protein n=1 Tax=Dermatophagoides pteronyssinus TaxID=6956 RepID=A0ABQ8J011_DERPT|nr:hypothetical protein DERP_000170 [Dermatophagoides pteronyssinus]
MNPPANIVTNRTKILMTSIKRPPYKLIEYKDAPKAVVGGRNIEPIDAANTKPKPRANGPPIVKNLSLGAQ